MSFQAGDDMILKRHEAPPQPRPAVETVQRLKDAAPGDRDRRRTSSRASPRDWENGRKQPRMIDECDIVHGAFFPSRRSGPAPARGCRRCAPRGEGSGRGGCEVRRAQRPGWRAGGTRQKVLVEAGRPCENFARCGSAAHAGEVQRLVTAAKDGTLIGEALERRLLARRLRGGFQDSERLGKLTGLFTKAALDEATARRDRGGADRLRPRPAAAARVRERLAAERFERGLSEAGVKFRRRGRIIEDPGAGRRTARDRRIPAGPR
jgi:hypothetical protein